jgi:hypothetical protein
MNALTAFSASDFTMPASFVTFSMSSALFTLPPGVVRAYPKKVERIYE